MSGHDATPGALCTPRSSCTCHGRRTSSTWVPKAPSNAVHGPSGCYWRCWIGPDTLFYRNHGAYLCDTEYNEEVQSTSLSARYTSGEENHYFGWQDAENDDARSLADKFLARFTGLASRGEGWSYAYAGWYQRLLGLADRGWMPFVLADYTHSYKKINLQDIRPAEWRTRK